MVNKTIVVGRLGKDPEFKQGMGGKSRAVFSLATTEKWKGGEHTEWYRVVCWGGLADTVSKYCQKGKLVFVEGSLRTRKYSGSDGAEKAITELNAQSVSFLSGGKAADTEQQSWTTDTAMQESDVPF